MSITSKFEESVSKWFIVIYKIMMMVMKMMMMIKKLFYFAKCVQQNFGLTKAKSSYHHNMLWTEFQNEISESDQCRGVFPGGIFSMDVSLKGHYLERTFPRMDIFIDIFIEIHLSSCPFSYWKPWMCTPYII